MLCVVVQVQAVLEEFYVNGDIQDVATTLEVDLQLAVAAYMTTLNPNPCCCPHGDLQISSRLSLCLASIHLMPQRTYPAMAVCAA